MLKRFAVLFCCAVLFAVFPASADQWNKRTVVTFSAPVELPGITLPAGTYVFKLADSSGDRHIVQVFNAEETHIYATILAIPNYRLTPKEDTMMRFAERTKGTPEALRAWFYPADNFGQEFVYPKARGQQLAESAGVPVLTAELPPAAKPEEMLKEPVTTVTPEKEVAVAPVEAPPVVEVAPPVVEKAEPAPPPPPVEVPIPEMPKTASPVPLVLLAGFGLLSLAGVLRAFVKHAA